jgi:hypothetical protein
MAYAMIYERTTGAIHVQHKLLNCNGTAQAHSSIELIQGTSKTANSARKAAHAISSRIGNHSADLSTVRRHATAGDLK